MAKKTFADELKSEAKSTAKRSVKKGIKKAIKGDSGGRRKKASRNIALKIIPYFLVVFALILAIFFIIVHIGQASAGFVGDLIADVFAGLFGGAAVLFPLVLGYFGVKWCIYNVKWKESAMDSDSDEYPDYKRAKGRLILQGIMSSLVIVVIAGLFGVFAGYDAAYDFDIIEMWENGVENLLAGGGGVIGSGLGALLVAGITVVPSVIVLIVLLVVFALLMVGLTPDYIIIKIKEAGERSKEARLARREEEREVEEAARVEAEKKAKEQAKAAAVSSAGSEQSISVKLSNDCGSVAAKGMSDEDIIDAVDGSDDSSSTVEEAKTANISFDPVEEMLGDTETAISKENGGDFGGEPGFDTDEYDPIEKFLVDMDTGEVIEEDGDGDVELTPLDIDDAGSDIVISEISTDDLRSDMAAVVPDEDDGEEEEDPPTPYIFPPISMLGKNKNPVDNNYNEEIKANAQLLVSTLESFKISIKDINASRGPTITRYELKPEAGVRVRSIANLVDDIALNLATSGVRIEAPIPGKAAVGIEVPNKNRATVYLRDLIENPQFTDAKSKLTAALGMDVGGNPIYFDISKMPHMLIAGATGMGKSVCINCVIISLLYKARPEDLKLILIDPKKVEFNIYKDIPHLYAPIVSDPKKAAGALASAVAEMERRFELIEEVGVRDIASYNAATENDPCKEHMPHMVIIIDELADLMMTAPDEVETAICRLAQKARAAGIHIVIGTQRPSVDVITGLIKANIPSRIACTVASQVDSRTIIDIAGAEKLIGRGDMLFAPVGAAKPMRVQGAFVTDTEVENICTFIRDNNTKAKYNAEFINRIEEEAAKCGIKKGGASAAGDSIPVGGDDGGDSKFQAAVKLAVEEGKISTSLMQRKLGVGYGRAAKIIDTMEEMGYVSKQDGNKPRRILITAEEYAERIANGTLGGADVE